MLAILVMILTAIAAIMVIHLDLKKLLIASIGILVSYWGLLWIGGSNDPYGLATNLARKIDIMILGESHLYGGTGIQFDPEGLLSTLPSVVTVIIGYLVGAMIHTTKDFFWHFFKKSYEQNYIISIVKFGFND